MVVGGLLAYTRSNHSGETAEFHVQNKVSRLSSVPPIVKRTSPAGLMETRISRGFSVGATKESFVSGMDGRIHEEVRRQSVRDVGREIEVLPPILPSLS